MSIDTSRKSLRQMSEKFDQATSNPLHDGKSGKSNASGLSAESNGGHVMLPVDKGIFRRKHDKVAPYNPDDLEAGGGGAAGGGAAAAEGGPDVGEDVPLLTNSGGRHASNTGSNNSANAAASGGMLGGFYSMLGWNKSASNNGKHHSAVLQKNESFDGHRNALISRWKRNAKSGAVGFADDVEQQVEVRERGYNIQGEENLHKYQRGKLSGVEAVQNKDGRHWAAAGLEGTIVRK